ncbi:GNAT family N-acetyltransferase [Sphingomonas sp. PB4P5]|uniref:GNAT family N-acetyltransferase n=1 Tax=Parasphingomonas puruogangriensis TaxID=3096155 RepID=UPI002FC74DC3
MTALIHRLATPADIPAIAALMERAIDSLQRDFLSPAEVAASRLSMGLDTQLIEDGNYFLVEAAGQLAGCGGWSRRATLYGGNHSAALRDDRLLDPAHEPARIRAMYTDPAFVRRGVGRLILSLAEAAARAAGFSRAEMMATLAGEPLYLACGYAPIERVEKMSQEGAPVPGVRMGKAL